MNKTTCTVCGRGKRNVSPLCAKCGTSKEKANVVQSTNHGGRQHLQVSEGFISQTAFVRHTIGDSKLYVRFTEKNRMETEKVNIVEFDAEKIQSIVDYLRSEGIDIK